MSEAVVALDVGEARIGLARGDTGSSFAFGRGYVRRSALEQDVAAIVEFVREEGASIVVVGLPLRTDGTDSDQTRRVREFAAALESAGLSVVTEDERFTTRIAGQNLLSSGLGRGRRREKGLVDQESAVLILESYLQRNRDRE